MALSHEVILAESAEAFLAGQLIVISGAESGAVNAYIFTHAGPVPATLGAGTRISLIPLNTNTGASTLNADGTGAVAIIRANGSALTGGELSSLGPVVLQSTGTQWQIVSTAGAQPGFERTAAEIAAGVTPTNFSYPPGYEGRFGMVDDGTTDNTTAFQNLLNGSAGYVAVRIRKLSGGSFYKLTARVTAPANTHIILEDWPTLNWTATTANGSTFFGAASRPGIEVLGNNFRLEGNGTLQGPTVAAYVGNEAAILSKGASSSSRFTGFTVNGEIEFLNWGAYGIALQFYDRVRVFRTRPHDLGYGGMTFNSCTNGRIMYNEVYNITPGTAGAAYGIQCSHDATNYNTDPLVNSTVTAITQAASAVVTISTVSGSNPFSVNQTVLFGNVTGMTQINGLLGNVTGIGGSSGAWTVTVAINSSGFSNYVSGGYISCQRQAANPFCIDFEVAFNTCRDIPVWRGIDFHGGFECRIHHNAVYNCYYPIGMSASSGVAAPYAGENNEVSYNLICAHQQNGNATTVATLNGVAIVLNGGSTINQFNTKCIGNVIDGYGLSGGDSGSIQASNGRNYTITHNTVRNWQQYCIFTLNGDGVIADNNFDSPSVVANSRCVYIQGNNYAWTIHDNHHEPHGATVAAEGLRFTPGGAKCILGPNDFEQASTPYVSASSSITLQTRFFAAVGLNNASPPAQVTGWGTPVGSAVINNYSITDAGGSNSNTNKAVAEIISALTALGLFGA